MLLTIKRLVKEAAVSSIEIKKNTSITQYAKYKTIRNFIASRFLTKHFAITANLKINIFVYLTNALQAFILVDALARGRHLESLPTVAAVSLRRVYAHPIVAEVAAQRALVNVLCADNLLGLFAQQVELCRGARGTRLAQVVRPLGPALAHGAAAAAVDPRQPEGHLLAALAAGREGGVAVALPSVQAGLAVLRGDEARFADAVEPGVGVDTAAPVAGVAPRLTLVLVHTLLATQDRIWGVICGWTERTDFSF